MDPLRASFRKLAHAMTTARRGDAVELSIPQAGRAALTEAEVAVGLIYEASLHPSPTVRAPAVWRELAARDPRGRFARLTANDIARVIGVVAEVT